MRFIALGLMLCAFLWACENSEADLQRFRPDTQAGVEKASQVELFYSDSAVVRVRIKAKTMLNHLDRVNPRREFPQGLLVDFFGPDQKPNSQLSARYAEYLGAQRKIFLRDSVVIWNNRDERLETQELVWNEADSSIYSTGFVKITSPEQIIYGYRFRSNADFTRWSLDSVSGIVQSRTLMDDNPVQ